MYANDQAEQHTRESEEQAIAWFKRHFANVKF
jgi:hypothetical protein